MAERVSIGNGQVLSLSPHAPLSARPLGNARLLQTSGKGL